jgi:excinuclease ABC subunit B
MPKHELDRLVRELEKQMKAAAEALEFEKAAMLRDQIFELREALILQEQLPGLPTSARRSRRGVR